MEGQGDLFEPEYLTYRPCNATETRSYVIERLQPIVDELNRYQAKLLAVAEGFHFLHHNSGRRQRGSLPPTNDRGRLFHGCLVNCRSGHGAC